MRLLSDDSVFNDPAKYAQSRQVALRYLRSDLSKLNGKELEAMVKLRRWIDANADAIARSLVEQHWPVSVGALERALRDIKNSIYDRRANLKNMQRVGHLLVLAQLHQMGHADERRVGRCTAEEPPRPRRLATAAARGRRPEAANAPARVSDAEGPLSAPSSRRSF